MKIAVAGKGGVGKTTVAAWLGDHLARQGRNVFMVDADTALSLGRASGLARQDLPTALIERHDLVAERIGSGILALSPEVGDLPESLSVKLPAAGPAAGDKRLLVMGAATSAGGGCACAANALLKALLAHLVLDRREWVIVDLEAGVEHLGRGTVAAVDGLVVVAEPSLRGLETAAEIARLARDLGLARQALVLNRFDGQAPEAGPEGFLGQPGLAGLPPLAACLPPLPSLLERQLFDGSVLGLPEAEGVIGRMCRDVLGALMA